MSESIKPKRANTKAYYQKNKEKFAESNKIYYEKNKAKMIETNAQNFKIKKSKMTDEELSEFKKKQREVSKDFYKKNSEKKIIQVKKYYNEKRDIILEKKQIERDLIKSLKPPKIKKIKIKIKKIKIKNPDFYECKLCNKSVKYCNRKHHLNSKKHIKMFKLNMLNEYFESLKIYEINPVSNVGHQVMK